MCHRSQVVRKPALGSRHWWCPHRRALRSTACSRPHPSRRRRSHDPRRPRRCLRRLRRSRCPCPWWRTTRARRESSTATCRRSRAAQIAARGSRRWQCRRRRGRQSTACSHPHPSRQRRSRGRWHRRRSRTCRHRSRCRCRPCCTVRGHAGTPLTSCHCSRRESTRILKAVRRRAAWLARIRIHPRRHRARTSGRQRRRRGRHRSRCRFRWCRTPLRQAGRCRGPCHHSRRQASAAARSPRRPCLGMRGTRS